MADRLHLVMPCMRPEYLGKIVNFYQTQMEPHPFEVRLHILFQGPEPDPKGVRKLNEGIAPIKDGWLLTVADDTLQHPALFRRIAEVGLLHPQAGAIVFSQDRGSQGLLRANPRTVSPGMICGGQVCWRRWLLGTEQFDYDRFADRADGHLIQKIYQANPSAFVFVPEVLMKFDSLMP